MATYVLYLKYTCTFRIFMHSFLYKLQSRVIISDSVSKIHLCSQLSEQKIQCLPIGTSVKKCFRTEKERKGRFCLG
jgi:hypothetical protein